MPILKLRQDDERAEAESELDYLTSLTTRERFELMLRKSREMALPLRRHGRRRRDDPKHVRQLPRGRNPFEGRRARQYGRVIIRPYARRREGNRDTYFYVLTVRRPKTYKTRLTCIATQCARCSPLLGLHTGEGRIQCHDWSQWFCPFS